MSDKAAAAEFKTKGNAAFHSKNFKEAIKHFTEAIKLDASDHVFFSNRSACYASLEKYEEALADGAECVKLNPDWPRGYTRKGLAEFFLEKYDEAIETYKAGLKLAPEDNTLSEGLKKASDAKYDVPGARPSAHSGAGRGGSGGGLPMRFDMSALEARAARNPKIKEYLQDKALMQKLSLLLQLGQGQNSDSAQQSVLQGLSADPRLLELYMAMQGIDLPDEDSGAFSSPPRTPTEPPKAEEEPAPDPRTKEQQEADEWKLKGNELYKKRQFEEAIEMYDKAIQVVPNDVTYFNNKCAVWVEMGPEHYDKVLETCQDLINRRYEINTANSGGASFEKVAKVFMRMASVHEKKKEYDEAIEYYSKSLVEDSTRQCRTALRECERAKEKFDSEAYVDESRALEHREKGNEHFKAGAYSEAKKEFDEAIKRHPSDAKLHSNRAAALAKLYSNRAAALTKLLAYPDALRDLEVCLKLDPTFVKAYSRKGAAYFYMKEYYKAMQAYEEGLKIDPQSTECRQGRDQVVATIGQKNVGEVDQEQVRHAMADPEIQSIMRDPQIQLFLKDMQENPREAQQAMMKDPKLQEAVSKLIAAGILRTG